MSREEDEMSLTSSIEENPESDTEWEIQGIIGDALLVEMDDNDQPLTRHKCLVSWTGFPLAEATWEPIENLPDETIAEWEVCKRKIEDDGGDPKESIRKWVREQERKIGGRYKRHKLRNKLRSRHGLNPKPWTVAGGQLPKELSDEMRRFYLQEAPSIWSPSESESDHFDRLDTPKARPPQSTASTQNKVHDNNNNSALNGSLSRGTRPPGTSLARKLSNAKQTAVVANQDSEKPRPTGLRTLPGVAKKPEPRKADPMAPVGNVFSGGKVRKQKPTLKDAAADPSRVAQHLNLHKHNLLYKASRNAEDRDPRRRPEVSEMSNPLLPGSSTSHDDRSQGPVTGPMRDPASHTNESRIESRPSSLKSSTTNTPDASDLAHGVRPPLKIRKTVSFGKVTTAIFNEQDDDNESELFVPEPSEQDLSTSTSTMTTTSEDLERPPTPPLGHNTLSKPKTVLVKECLIGSQASKPVNMGFSGLPQHDQPWFRYFRSCNRVVLGHWCKVDELRTQLPLLTQREPLAKGTLSTLSDPDLLQSIRQRLNSLSESIICVTPNYMITVFPPQYEEWNLGEFDFPENADPLRYIIWAPRSPDGSTPGAFSLGELASASSKGESTESRSMPQGLARLVHLDCTALLPKTTNSTARLPIFIAFPVSNIAEARMMADWMSMSMSSRRECKFYDCLAEGDWMSFIREGCGTIIIHEDILWKVRLFPDMADVLEKAARGLYAISVFDRALSTSATSLWRGETPRIGNVCVRPVFQGGWVFHLCPTVFVAQPRQAYMFLKWFMHACKQGRPDELTRRGRLVIPANLDEWLMDLAIERESFLIEKEKAVAKADLANLYKAVALTRELMQIYPRDEAQDQDDTPFAQSAFALIYVPPVIDPNDEQSLLNWLGWWSIANMDKYSRIFAICTSKVSHKLARRIAPVRWQQDTVSHERPQDPGQISNFDGRSPGPSELAGEDSPEALRDHLESITKISAYLGQAVFLNFYPVGYPDLHEVSQLLGHYRHYTERFTDFAAWFRKLHPITPQGIQVQVSRGLVKNTLAGLFLTPEGNWREAMKENQKAVLRRRPWFALFRPVEPHSRPWISGSELLIWDPSYAGKVSPGEKFTEADMAPIHREFVRIIGEENGRKNPQVPLRKVWVGGWASPKTRYRDPLDIVLEQLTNFVLDARTYVPSPAHKMPERGWKHAKPSSAEELKRADEMDQASLKDLKSKTEDITIREPADARMVFHPPRGRTTDHPSPNLFYKWTQDAAKEGGVVETGGSHTLVWYGQQRSDGRDFKHIVVADYEKIFPELGIPLR